MNKPYPMEKPADTTVKKPFSAQPTGYLMGWFGVLVLLAMLLLAAWNGQTVIAVLLGLAISAAGLSRAWSRMSLVRVTCQRSISECRIFPGEHTELKLSVANRKILPVPWIEIDNEIPLGLVDGSSIIPETSPSSGLISRSTALLWYTAASWRCRLYGKKRGYYPLGPVTTTSGDIFGFYPCMTTIPSSDHIIVYPRLYTIIELGIPSLYPLGETISERRIFEDPTRAIGVRDYTPRDSLRYIHWKASARHQRLQVKVFEPSTTLKVAIFLAVDSFWHYGALKEEDLELGISTAASVAKYTIEHGSSTGLFVNSPQADSGQPVRILPGGNASHIIGILEALAKVTASTSQSLTEFFQNERGDMPMGTTLIFVLSHTPQSITGLLTSLKHAGYKLLVLQVGNNGSSRIESEIDWRQVRQDSNLVKISTREGQ